MKDTVCDVCGSEFSQAGNMKRHKKQVHLKIRDHICSVCDIGFSTSSDLKAENIFSWADVSLNKHEEGWARERVQGCMNSRPAAKRSQEAGFTQPVELTLLASLAFC